MFKKRGNREVDLLKPRKTDKPWKREWRAGLVTEPVHQLLHTLGVTEGAVIIKTDEIESRLHHSKDYLGDISRAALGFGEEVIYPCGCDYKIMVNGDTVAQYVCDSHSEGIPPFDDFKDLPLAVSSQKSTASLCGDCGDTMLWDKHAARKGRYVCPKCRVND